MTFSIISKQMKCGDYVAQVDWTQHDAGAVGTPGAVKYAKTAEEAEQKLKTHLETKGHTIL